jgi:hypothetical protein
MELMHWHKIDDEPSELLPPPRRCAQAAGQVMETDAKEALKVTCPGCKHASHNPTGPLKSRGCLESRCYCLMTSDATGKTRPPVPHVPSVEERREMRARREAHPTPSRQKAGE